MLAAYCATQGWNFQVIQDLGSGMNYQKGLKTVINLILEKKISRLVLTHKDRLLRFGAELIFALCEVKQIEVVIINKGDEVFRRRARSGCPRNHHCLFSEVVG